MATADAAAHIGVRGRGADSREVPAEAALVGDADDRGLLHPRATHDGAGLPARVAPVQERADGSGNEVQYDYVLAKEGESR